MSRRRQASPEGLARHARRPERWSEWAALGFAAARPMGHVAAREGWLGGLVDFIRDHQRLPDGRETPRLRREATDMANWCAAILAAPEQRPCDATVARAIMTRRERMAGYVMAQPEPAEERQA